MTRSHPELNIWSATTYLCTAKLPTPQASDTPGFQSLLTSAATAAVRAASAPVSLLRVDGSPCLRLRAPLCSLWPLPSLNDAGEAFALALPAPCSAQTEVCMLPCIASFRSLFKCHLFRKIFPITSNLKLKKSNSSCSSL